MYFLFYITVMPVSVLIDFDIGIIVKVGVTRQIFVKIIRIQYRK
jgi:hypothetical protein